MPKSKLNQIATTWVDEDNSSKKKESAKKEKSKNTVKKPEKKPKKKQTFNLKAETVQRLWAHRVRSGKTISEIIDELVDKNLSKVKNI